MIKFETAKLLVKAGWTKEVEFYYMWSKDRPEYTAQRILITASERKRFSDRYNIIPCPSTDEVVKELPREILIHNPRIYYATFQIDRKTILWRCGYLGVKKHFLTGEDVSAFLYVIRHNELDEAMSLLWLLLRKEKII